jgi:hypothetical protein
VAVQTLVERLARHYAEGPHLLEAMRAREEFFERAGKVFDDDGDLFEERMAAFLEWYIIERPWGRKGPSEGSGLVSVAAAGVKEPRVGSAPVLAALEEAEIFSAAERREAALVATSHHSLFLLHTVKDQQLGVEDLLGGARFSVRERRSTLGFEPGGVFEARLIWDGEGTVFGKTFLFHPPDAREAVLELADACERENAPRTDLLFRLSRAYVRWHRQGHLGAAKIYKGDTPS